MKDVYKRQAPTLAPCLPARTRTAARLKPPWTPRVRLTDCDDASRLPSFLAGTLFSPLPQRFHQATSREGRPALTPPRKAAVRTDSTDVLRLTRAFRAGEPVCTADPGISREQAKEIERNGHG